MSVASAFHTPDDGSPAARRARYGELHELARAVTHGEPDLIANLANLVALVREAVGPRASWVGFYRRLGNELVLGPFVGNVACVRIAMGRGVCGTAAAQKAPILVPDVANFDGHIACDAQTQSELVVPICRNGETLGVLDLDSYARAAFDEIDVAELSQLATWSATFSW